MGQGKVVIVDPDNTLTCSMGLTSRSLDLVLIPVDSCEFIPIQCECGNDAWFSHQSD